MYAVFKNGGKQYKVRAGDVILLDKFSADPKSDVIFDEILLTSDENGAKIGDPFVPGAKIFGTVINDGRGKKVITFKKRRRKDSKTKRGFRRDFTRVSIQKITF